jgi:type IV secretion system protein VirB5
MITKLTRSSLLGVTLAVAVSSAAHAQWAVVDVGAIAQLAQEVTVLRQQLVTAEAQLSQAKAALDTTTGNRGMQLLLGGTVRNYLPTSSSQLMGAIQGTGAYPGLSSDVRAAVSSNAVMSPVQLSVLAPQDQAQIASARQAVALRQSVAQEALANSSSRFASIQALISAIAAAGDQKAILDLQARIGAELGMLENEQTKLQILSQASDALRAANAERAREYTIVGQGRFETRFQPVP